MYIRNYATFICTLYECRYIGFIQAEIVGIHQINNDRIPRDIPRDLT